MYRSNIQQNRPMDGMWEPFPSPPKKKRGSNLSMVDGFLWDFARHLNGETLVVASDGVLKPGEAKGNRKWVAFFFFEVFSMTPKGEWGLFVSFLMFFVV